MVLTPTQKKMLLTAGIANESETVFNVWDKCYYNHDTIFTEDCFWAVRYAIIRWLLELSVLEPFTNCCTNWLNASRQFYLNLVGSLNDILVDLGNRI
jgi:hypothetical protein